MLYVFFIFLFFFSYKLFFFSRRLNTEAYTGRVQLAVGSRPLWPSANGADNFGYIHEAEGRNKNLFFLVQALV